MLVQLNAPAVEFDLMQQLFTVRWLERKVGAEGKT
jgi:hypothetical protein